MGFLELQQERMYIPIQERQETQVQSLVLEDTLEISSWDENDSLSSTEEESQLFTSTSRGAFPQKCLCERDSVFSASSGMDPEMP